MSTTTRNNSTRGASRGPSYLTRSEAQELVDSIVKKATRELSRELEKHLKSIHERLVKVETKP